MTYDVADAHPESASVVGDGVTTITLPGRVLAWKARLEIGGDEKNFFYRLRRELSKDGVVIRQKVWQEPIPRDLQ